MVDLGAGSGFYSLEAARVVGAEGRVYAIDIQKNLLDRIKTVADSEKLTNLDVLWGDIEKVGGSKVGTDKADLVFICNTLFQVTDRDSLLTEVFRITRPNGRVCVIDWEDSHFGMGPDQDKIVSHKNSVKVSDSTDVLSKMGTGLKICH